MDTGATFFLVIFILSHLLILQSAQVLGCPPYFQCGALGGAVIGFPFYNTEHPGCGLFEVDCEGKKVKFGKESEWYNVVTISMSSIQIRVQQLNESLLNPERCDSLKNLTFPNSPSISFRIVNDFATFIQCTNTSEFTSEMNEHFRNYSKYTDCPGYSFYYNHRNKDVLDTVSLPPNCIIQLPPPPPRNLDPFQLGTAQLELGLHVSGQCSDCVLRRGGTCDTNDDNEFLCANGNQGSGRKLVIEVAIGTSTAVVAITIVLFRLFWRKCSWFKSTICRNKKTKDHEDIEALLKKYGPLVPERYRYSDVKKMTNSFRDKLGQGSYGGVYKGKLQDGRTVAVKILNESKGNGEEFVNEVGSISRTSHINNVALLGFCFEGPKRSLIFEFMSNGSLEKFIYNEKSLVVRQLGWETLYQIALGIGRGLEYLHRGCNTRILHFDIKPHNILLDEELSPKISDFGLAKLCPEKVSVVSMSGMRGTPGYIAPEVFSRNFGGVSHKSDVYSYGMMILEMVGGTKNPHEGVGQSSEIYFPDWIYKRLELDGEIGANGEENENKRKMIIVGLWCIQIDPSNRPSMRRVLDMLEGSLESLQVPPRPILVFPPKHQADSSATESMQVM